MAENCHQWKNLRCKWCNCWLKANGSNRFEKCYARLAEIHSSSIAGGE